MSMAFSLSGTDLAATLRRISENALKRAADKRQKQTEEGSDDQPGE
jgi:hypothetical protein